MATLLSDQLKQLQGNQFAAGKNTAGSLSKSTIELSQDAGPTAHLNDDPFTFSSISYPKDVTDGRQNGHYMLFYINVQNKTKYNYIDALGGFGASGTGANGVQGNGSMWYQEGNALSFRGVQIEGVFGLADDTAFAFEKSRIMFGTDLAGDYTEVKLLDQSEVNGDDVVNCIMKFSGDTNYVASKDVVYYGTTA